MKGTLASVLLLVSALSSDTPSGGYVPQGTLGDISIGLLSVWSHTVSQIANNDHASAVGGRTMHHHAMRGPFLTQSRGAAGNPTQSDSHDLFGECFC